MNKGQHSLGWSMIICGLVTGLLNGLIARNLSESPRKGIIPTREGVCSLSAWIFALLTSQFCEGLVGLYQTKLAQLKSRKSRARREKEECRYSLLHWLERHKHSFINVPRLATLLFLWADHTPPRVGIFLELGVGFFLSLLAPLFLLFRLYVVKRKQHM